MLRWICPMIWFVVSVALIIFCSYTMPEVAKAIPSRRVSTAAKNEAVDIMRRAT
jgi:hypothetical protein